MAGGVAGGGGTINAAGCRRGEDPSGSGDLITHGHTGVIGSTGTTGHIIGITDRGGRTGDGEADPGSGASRNASITDIFPRMILFIRGSRR